MSGKVPVTTNQYAAIDETVTFEQGVISLPFRIIGLMDMVINDGPGEAAVTFDGGAPIALLPGDFRGPWQNFHASTITVQCMSEALPCRVRATGV